MSLVIKRYASIRGSKAWLEGNIVFASEETDPSVFLRSLYRDRKISYPKFFKMDNLCKLGFLGAEMILGDMNLPDTCRGEDIAIIMQNGSSSLETDERHQETISDRENYFPSPSVFVYTLPNIVVGEIAIRHRIEGENAVLISDRFDAVVMADTVSGLFTGDRVRLALAGWIECYKDRCETLMVVVEEQKKPRENELQESIIFDAQNLEKLFTVA